MTPPRDDRFSPCERNRSVHFALELIRESGCSYDGNVPVVCVAFLAARVSFSGLTGSRTVRNSQFGNVSTSVRSSDVLARKFRARPAASGRPGSFVDFNQRIRRSNRRPLERVFPVRRLISTEINYPLRAGVECLSSFSRSSSIRRFFFSVNYPEAIPILVPRVFLDRVA